MGIKSGTITHTCGEFYLEAATGSEELDTRFEHYINYFTSEGDIPVDSVEISRIGEFNGGWKFWDDLYRQERENNFTFKPQFLIPDGSVDIPNWIVDRYGVDDYKISGRILFYPFGYFVVRWRTYFEFSSSRSVEKFINFQESLEKEIKIQNESDSIDIQSVFEEINEFVFRSDVPDYYVGKNRDRRVSTINYLYQYYDLNKQDRAKLIHQDSRNMKQRTALKASDPYLGYLQGDEISIDPKGAVIVTPAFDDIREENRRWKRIHLLNNIYIAYDFALLERYHMKRIRDFLVQLLDEFNHGTILRNPLDHKYLPILDAVLEFGIHLKVTRGEVYNELEPVDMKERIKPDIDDTITRLLDHDPILKKYMPSIISLLE